MVEAQSNDRITEEPFGGTAPIIKGDPVVGDVPVVNPVALIVFPAGGENITTKTLVVEWKIK